MSGIERLVLNSQTRAVTPENPTGEKGKGGMATPEEGTAGNCAADLGVGWKVNPFIVIPSGQTWTLADIHGSGVIRHIWLTPTGWWRNLILRFYDVNEGSVSIDGVDIRQMTRYDLRQLIGKIWEHIRDLPIWETVSESGNTVQIRRKLPVF